MKNGFVLVLEEPAPPHSRYYWNTYETDFVKEISEGCVFDSTQDLLEDVVERFIDGTFKEKEIGHLSIIRVTQETTIKEEVL